jgi:hypothetical protein
VIPFVSYRTSIGTLNFGSRGASSDAGMLIRSFSVTIACRRLDGGFVSN